MSSPFDKNIPVAQPNYCEKLDGTIDAAHPVYNWMSIRSGGPNTLRDNHFCGGNEFGSNVQIDGDLNVDGEITGDINVPPPYQGEIPCIEISANLNPATNQQADWLPTGMNGQVTTIVIQNANQANINLSGIVHLGQCYLILFNNTTDTIRLMDENNASNTSAETNRFRINATSVLPINSYEAIQLYYCHAIERWVLVSHL